MRNKRGWSRNRRSMALLLTFSMLISAFVGFGFPRSVQAADSDADRITSVLSPAYRSDITEDTVTIEFYNKLGTTAKVYSQKQPGDLNNTANGTKELVGEVTLADGHGSVDFPASEYPYGPISVRIQVFQNGTELDNAYLQLNNKAGVQWRNGLDNAPANPVTSGMDVVYTDDFKTMPTINKSGIGATYASAKVDEARGGMFGWAAFEDYDGAYNPFSIADNEFMQLTTTYHPTGYVRNDYWKQKVSTGYLSSMNQAGGGFHTEGGRNQYFEARMFFGPNPGMWPAFWTLTANGYVQNPDLANQPSDELDILEGYMGTPQGYQIAWHPWGYDKPAAADYDASKLGGGYKVDLDTPAFNNINLAMGFHTLGVYVTKDWTYYYCDNIEVTRHKTLPFSWQYGNYFILNAAVSDHYGIDGNAADPFENFDVPGGFTRYGNESDTYVDWVRVYQDAPDAVRFESDASVKALSGDVVRVNVSRNDAAAALSGAYHVDAPNGWKIMSGGQFVDMNGTYNAAFAAGSANDTLTFLVPGDYTETSNITITPVASDDTSYAPIVVSATATGAEGELIRVDATTYPYRNTTGGDQGSWASYDPGTNSETYFNFIDGGWWRDGWSWMYVNENASTAMEFKFNGTTIGLDMTKCSECGEGDIYLDGQLQQHIDTNAPADQTVRIFEKSGLADGDHTLKITGANSSVTRYLRIAGFEFRHFEDPNMPKFWSEDTFFKAGGGDEIAVNISRNGAAGTRFGTYELTFPTSGWQVKAGGEWQTATSQSFSTNHYTDTLQFKVPANYASKDGKIIITPTISDGTYPPIKVTVQAPDAPEAPPITGSGEIRTVDSATYPYVTSTGGTDGAWTSFDHSSQPNDYFAFNGNWWKDSWAWMYITAGTNQDLTFAFEGDAVGLYARYIDGGSSFDVYIDDVKQGSVDTNGSSGKRRVFSKSGLPAGNHTLKLVVTKPGGSIVLEGFEYDYVKSNEVQTIRVDSSTYPYVGKTDGTAPAPTSGPWTNFDPSTQGKAYFTTTGGWWNDSWGWMYDNAGNNGDVTAFTFDGTAVSVFMRTYSKGGLLDVYLDGAFQSTIDSRSDAETNNAKVFEKTGLRGGEHKLELKVKSESGREAVVISGFEYVHDPSAAVPGFAAPASVDVVQGENASITIARDELAQELAGTYEVTFPDEDWSVVSGGSFTAGSASDTIVVSVPADYALPNGQIKIAPIADGVKYAAQTVSVVAPKIALPNLVTLQSPAYRADIDGETTLNFSAKGGYAKAAAYMLHQPDAQHADASGYIVKLGDVTLDADGKGSIAFDADQFPHGPVAVKVTATKADGTTAIEDYFQFYNAGGADWNMGLDNAPMPAQLAGLDMDVTFQDDYKTMPTISKTGKDGQGNRTTYASHKPDYKDYGNALFADRGGAYDPFRQVEDYLKIKTTYYEDPLPSSVDGYQRHYTTGFLSSVGDDGVGFRTKGYADQYFEARFFVGANPNQWPAFWTLTGVNDEATDELDIIEAYPPNVSGYSIATHPWGYDNLDGGGKAVNTVDLVGSDAGNISMGFHTYGVLIQEDYTTYYFDNKEVYKQKTLPLSWRKGSYFLINNAMTQSDAFPPGYGFERYGDQSDMYIDWVRVYEHPQSSSDVVFDTAAFSPVNVTPGEDLSVDIHRVTDGAKALSGTYQVDMPEGWTVVAGGTFAAGASKDTLVLHVPDNYAKYVYELKITPVGSNGTPYKTMTVQTKNTDDSLGVEIYPAQNADKTGWDVKVALTNKNDSGSIAGGTVQVEEPAAVAASYGFGDIAGGATQYVTIPASMLSPDSRTHFAFRVTNADGYDRTFAKDITDLTATRVDPEHPIAVNGAIDPDQWAGSQAIHLGEGQSTSTDGKPYSASDRSADQYVKWDDDYLYLAVQVTDDVHSMASDNVYDSWGSDSLQVSFDPERPGRTASSDSHPRFIASLNAATGVSALGVETWGPVTTGNVDDIPYKFTRDEAHHLTNYVIAFPWSSLLTDARKPATADLTDLGISVLVNDNDGGGREGWLAYMDGISSGKDPLKFGDLILSSESSLQATPADKTAPVTDMTAVPSEPDGQNGWYVHPVELQLTASDDRSGVAQTEYSVDGGATWLPYDGPIALHEDASTTIRYRSTDAAGNLEAAKESLIQLDMTAPAVTASVHDGEAFTDDQTIKPEIVVSDAVSGVDASKTVVTLDGARLQSGETVELSGLALGTHVLVAEASDNAGNAGTLTVHFQTTATIDSLRALVDGFRADGSIDNGGIANSLSKKLEKGNLDSFVNEVSAQSGKHISNEAAACLLRDAAFLIRQQQ
ncbi:Glycosyl hydrolases family 16 [Paenibacillus sp. UNC496MF]|uniref:OmpL47-type beta-barrel domain-containing protein n=1 Tax=Paenibacillus sp. UNC496MF TaxID=1502753 RepID=UPI0008E88DE9|nr:sugar-binding protein [Paenibacillus sp. UNC496MF]SFI98396.1 Glycosyl hydrolases family 16 [Paenibacillus sp. UNC496MF]